MSGAQATARKVHVVSGRVECPESLHLAACLEKFFRADGCAFVATRDEADIVVLNGCERIAETPAVVASYLDYAKAHPRTNVLVVGCVPKSVADAGGVANFHIVPFWKLVREPSLIGPQMGFGSAFSLLKKDDVFHGHFPLDEHYPGNPPPEEICLLTIGSGCSGGCTFCTIKRGRGRQQSLPPEEILADVRAALDLGRFRFVLLADDAGCWGHDLGLELPWLLAEIVALCPDARFLIRPMSPAFLLPMYERLRPFLGRVDYIYLPIQSASDRILTLMNRGHAAPPILELLRRFRAEHPGVHLKTDFIVGFPGETQAEFRESVQAARLFHHASFHRFLAYPGTPAARLPGQLGPEELDRRVEVVRRLGFTIVDPSTYTYDHDGEGNMAVADATRRVHVVTGNSECLNNLYLAVCLEQYFEGMSFEFTDDEAGADVLILNVCNVLAETPDLIRRYQGVAAADPHKQVLVLGCVPGGFATKGDAGNFHVIPYGQLVRNPKAIGPKMGFTGNFSFLKADQVFSDLLPNSRVPFPPAECCYITIGSGCEGKCTYCSIRSGRGAARSLDPEEIVADAKRGFASGRRRLVLIADDAGCWGRDRGLDLPYLLGRLRDACPEARFVLLDFNPRNLPLIWAGLKPFIPVVDFMYMPLQAGSDRILGLMDRGYTRAEVLGLIREIKALHPEMVLETDVIVGFPTETRAEFLESLEAAKLFDSAAFVPFVPKTDTPAARLAGRLEPAEMRARMDLVRREAPGHRFKPIDTSYQGSGHGGVGKVTLVVETERNGKVLQAPEQVCLSRHASVDFTAGCPLECVYCDQEFPPGSGPRTLLLYADTLKQMIAELEARKKPPQLVYFSSHCEPFVNEPRVLDLLYQAMSLLLERDVFVLVETRAEIPERFVDLFARHVERVKVQVGLSTVDDSVRAVMEPHAPSVERRLATVRSLVDREIPLEVGVGPLTPGLDDSGPSLAALLSEYARAGARRGNVSFLHLEDASRRRMATLTHGSWSFAEMEAKLYSHCDTGCTGGKIWRAEQGYRDRKWAELKALGDSLGIDLRLCRCNNPDRIAPSPDDSPLTRGPGVAHHHDEHAPAKAATAAAAAAPRPAARPAAPAAPLAPAAAVGAGAAAAPVSAPAAAPAAGGDSATALLAYVTAGTDLHPVAGNGPPPDAMHTAPAPEAARVMPSAPLITVPIGSAPDSPDAWRAAGEAGGPTTLLPGHAATLRELCRWLGRNGFGGEAVLAADSVRVEVPEPKGDGKASIEITLDAPGRRCFQRVPPYGISYRGTLTPTAKLVADRVVQYLGRVTKGKR